MLPVPVAPGSFNRLVYALINMGWSNSENLGEVTNCHEKVLKKGKSYILYGGSVAYTRHWMLLGQIAVKASLATYRSNKQPKLTSDFPLEFSIFNRTRNCCCPHWQFLHFQQNKKEFKLHPDYSGILEQIKPYNPVIRRQRSSLSPSPCLSSKNHHRTLVEKALQSEVLTVKLMAKLGSAPDSLGWLDWLAQTQNISESETVAAGSCWLVWWKSVTTLEILT